MRCAMLRMAGRDAIIDSRVMNESVNGGARNWATEEILFFHIKVAIIDLPGLNLAIN